MAEPESYRINEDDEQVRLEQARLLTLARVVDPATRAVLEPLVAARAGRAATSARAPARSSPGWPAGSAPTGRVAAPSTSTPASSPRPSRRSRSAQADVTDRAHRRRRVRPRPRPGRPPAPGPARGRARRHGRGGQARRLGGGHRHRLDPVRRPGHPRARSPRSRRRCGAISVQQHGYDGDLGPPAASPAFQARGLTDVDASGQTWTMHGGTDSAEWYVGALDRALPVLPREIFPDGLRARGRHRPGPGARLRHPLADVGHLRRAEAVMPSPTPPSSPGRSPAPRPRPGASCSTPPATSPRPRATTASPCARWPPRAGVSAPTAYQYFTSKDHLLVDVLVELVGDHDRLAGRPPGRGRPRSPTGPRPPSAGRSARSTGRPDLYVALTRAYLSGGARRRPTPGTPWRPRPGAGPSWPWRAPTSTPRSRTCSRACSSPTWSAWSPAAAPRPPWPTTSSGPSARSWRTAMSTDFTHVGGGADPGLPGRDAAAGHGPPGRRTSRPR